MPTTYALKFQLVGNKSATELNTQSLPNHNVCGIYVDKAKHTVPLVWASEAGLMS